MCLSGCLSLLTLSRLLLIRLHCACHRSIGYFRYASFGQLLDSLFLFTGLIHTFQLFLHCFLLSFRCRYCSCISLLLRSHRLALKIRCEGALCSMLFKLVIFLRLISLIQLSLAQPIEPFGRSLSSSARRLRRLPLCDLRSKGALCQFFFFLRLFRLF